MTNTKPVPTDPAQQRAEWARICNNQIAARQSRKFEAANLADIAAAETGGDDEN